MNAHLIVDFVLGGVAGWLLVVCWRQRVMIHDLRSRLMLTRPMTLTEIQQVMTEPVAWLIKARKPGTRSEWASICDDGSEAWPLDQGWVTVTRTPLVECGPAENILPERYAVAEPSMSTTSPSADSGPHEPNEGQCGWLVDRGRYAGYCHLSAVPGKRYCARHQKSIEGGAKP